MKYLLILLLSCLAGCATIKAVQTPQAFAACTVADTATTVYAVHNGLGHEVNPLLSGSVNAHRFVPLVLSKLAVIGLVWWVYDRWQTKATKVGTGVATVATCGIAASNVLQIMK